MRIGIIGAGHISGNLTRRPTALAHEVSVANSRGPHTLTDLAEETGAKPVTASEAAQGAQVVVVTVPLDAVPDLPAAFSSTARRRAQRSSTPATVYGNQGEADAIVKALSEASPERTAEWRA